MFKKILAKKFAVSLALILIISFILRFINYANRWGLAYDQAHDALLARYAISVWHLPLVGPFASGAQFQTSGLWYWFLMIATLIYPPSVITPWLIITLSYALFVLLMVLIGKELEGKYFGLLVGVLTAVSTAQIAQATNLTLTAPMCFISALAILTFIKYSKTKQKKYLFLLGLSFGLAPTTHLQGVLLIIVLPIFLLTLKIKDVKSWAILILGLIIPTIPLIIFDFRNNFVNSLGLINYLLHGQYKTSYDALGRRWSTYLTVFWPHAWALIIGGYTAIAYLTGLLFSLLLIEKIFKRDINKLWIALAGSLILIAIAMRYVRNPLFDSYLVFLHPFILLFSALAIFWLWKKNLYLGLLLLLLLAIGSLRQDYSIILNSTNTTAAIASSWQNTLVHKYPNQKFAIYDYNYKAAGYSLPLSLYLESQNKLDDNGLKIGIMQATKGAMLQFSALPTINSGNDNYQIFDMNSSNSAELIKNGWVSVNPSSVYKAVEDWHKNK